MNTTTKVAQALATLIADAKADGSLLSLYQAIREVGDSVYEIYESEPVEVRNHCCVCNRDWIVMVPQKEERDACGIDHCPTCWNETPSGLKYGPSKHSNAFRYEE